LQIAGTGPEERALRELAGPTIEFLGRVGEAELKTKYASCRALLFAADEDFGLVSVEAQAHGRPVIAYGRGGSLETVRGVWADETNAPDPALCAANYTGVFFSIQSAPSLAEAMLGFERIEECFDPGTIHEHARRFDREVFVREVGRFVEEQTGSQKRPVFSDERGSRQL
jgi:glycosyltransferase involved in cell wall biosynthesis